MSTTPPRPIGLCYRCEYRAVYLETHHGTRCECGDVQAQVRSCYMFQPARPLVMEVNTGDRRSPAAPAMLRARSHAVGFAEANETLTVLPGRKRRFVQHWRLTP